MQASKRKLPTLPTLSRKIEEHFRAAGLETLGKLVDADLKFQHGSVTLVTQPDGRVDMRITMGHR